MPAIFTHFSLNKNKQPLFAIFRKVNFQITTTTTTILYYFQIKQFRVSSYSRYVVVMFYFNCNDVGSGELFNPL